MRKSFCVLALTLLAAYSATAADDTSVRMDKAVATLRALTGSKHGIPEGQIASADCVAVVPGFKKVAAVVGVGHGRGFISCRNDGAWSAPAAIALDSGNLGVELGGEALDIVIVSMDPGKRAKLLSDRFAMGSDASAAWGNGKSAREDSSAQIRFYARTKGVFAGFGLDGVTLKADQSGDHELYGEKLNSTEIVGGGTKTPEAATPLVAALTQAAAR